MIQYMVYNYYYYIIIIYYHVQYCNFIYVSALSHIIHFLLHWVINIKWPDKACTLIFKQLLHPIIKMYNVLPTCVSSGTQINTDLLKRNIVTCVIRPKINIIQVELFPVTYCM